MFLISLLISKSLINIILNNIIQNAQKYTRKKIRIMGRVDKDNFVILELIDDGGGINDRERLDQSNSGSAISSSVGRSGQLGSGLGLFMVSDIVNRNNGSIRFSNFKDGLKVELKFPHFEEAL